MKNEYVPKKDYRPVINDAEVLLRGFAPKKPSYETHTESGEGDVLFDLKISIPSGQVNGLYRVGFEIGYRENRFDKSWENSLHSAENFSFPEQKVGIETVTYTFTKGYEEWWMSASPDHTGNLFRSVIFASKVEKGFQARAARMFIDHGALLKPNREHYFVKLREPIKHILALQFMLEELERMSQ